MNAPIFTVETSHNGNGWSYIVGSNGYREGPIRYRWEAQEWADEMNKIDSAGLNASDPATPAGAFDKVPATAPVAAAVLPRQVLDTVGATSSREPAMKLVAHDQRDNAVTHRYSIQREDGRGVWLLFDIPKDSPFEPLDVAMALEEYLPRLERHMG